MKILICAGGSGSVVYYNFNFTLNFPIFISFFTYFPERSQLHDNSIFLTVNIRKNGLVGGGGVPPPPSHGCYVLAYYMCIRTVHKHVFEPTQPVFMISVSKPIFVIFPVSEEVCFSVYSPLNYLPEQNF